MSTYAGPYQCDVFVSYATVDDAPVFGNTGWVTDFIGALNHALNSLSGRRDRIRVFKDTMLRKQERFSEALDRNVQSSAVFVALLSSGFQNSPFCQRELQLFIATETRNGGSITSPSGLQRVVPVRLAGRKILSTGPLISDVIGYDFAEADNSRFPIGSRSEDFVSRVRELAVGVMDILNDLREHGGKATSVEAAWLSESAKQLVYRILAAPVVRLNDEDRRLALVRRAYASTAPGLCWYLERVGGRNIDEWTQLVVEAALDYGIMSSENAVGALLEAAPDSNFLDPGILMEAKSEVARCWRQHLQGDEDVVQLNVRHARLLFGERELDLLIERPADFWSSAWELRSGERWKRIILMNGSTFNAGDEDAGAIASDLRRLTELRHRNIVPIEDFSRTGSILQAECGWRPGDHLGNLSGPVGQTQLKSYVEQLSDALDFAHLRGVVHGRLNPESLVLDTARDFISILGFGYFMDEEPGMARKIWEAPQGFDPFVAPEARRGSPVPASDQYSLAVLTYSLLLGVKRAGSSVEALRQAARGLIPEPVAEVIETALADDPGRRFGTTMEFADALKWSLDTGMSQSAERAKEQTYLNLLRQECVHATVGYVRLAGRRYGRNRRYTAAVAAATGAGRVRVQHPMLFRVSHASSQETSRLTEDVSRDLRSGGRILLLGEPGSGKSTTLIHAALEACREAQLDRGAPIPVVVPLNLYDGHQSLDEFIKAQMPELGLEYDRLLSDNRLLLLFDALNEMGPEGRRAISGFVKSLRDFVVSCRTKDYERDLEDVSGLTLITILFLDILGIRLAFEKILGPQWEQLWGSVGGCRALLDRHQKMRLRGESERFWEADYTPEYTSEQEDLAWNRAHLRGVLELCRSPFSLRVVTDIFVSEGQVPQERSAIFAASVQTLIRRELDRLADAEGWDINDPRRTQFENLIRQALSEVAGLIQERQNGAGVNCELAMANILQDVEIQQRERMLDLAEDANILVRQGERFVFSHQLVQEFFASAVVRGEFEGGGYANRFFPQESWYRPQGWEETAIILAGMLGSAGLERFVRWVAEAQPSVALRCIEEAGIPGLSIETISHNLKAWLRERWLQLWKAEEQRPLARAVVGRALASVGDPRPGVGTRVLSSSQVPDIEWVEPEGLGVKIAKYPVTAGQYRCFVDLSRQVEGRNATLEAGCATWPVTNISWAAADEFAKWLSEKLQTSVRLPWESEWKQALSWYGRSNAWTPGNGNVADGSEDEVGSPSPVGTYWDGEGAVADMFGDVWEWCLDSAVVKMASQDGAGKTRQAFRLLKGGSWRGGPEFATIDYRYWARDDYSSDDIGFRLVWDVSGREVAE